MKKLTRLTPLPTRVKSAPNRALAEWLETRPEEVRKLVEEFPPGTRVIIDGCMHWVIAYDEKDTIAVTPIDPAKDYEAAVSSRKPVCAAHLRGTKQ